MDISSLEISVRASFGPEDLPAHGHFITVDASVQELFSMGTFQAQGFFGTRTFQHSSTGVKKSVPKCPYCSQGAKISMCRNVQVLKYPMSFCRFVHGTKNSVCQNVPKPKNIFIEMSMDTKCPKHAHAQMSW